MAMPASPTSTKSGASPARGRYGGQVPEAHLVRDEGVAGSNPATPTNLTPTESSFSETGGRGASPPGQLSGQKRFMHRLAASPMAARGYWPGSRRGAAVCLIRRTAGYGPVRPVVWEGRSRETSPHPDPPFAPAAAAA